MDSKFQSSFIPRTSVVGQTFHKESSGPLGKLASLIFVLALLGLGGLFAYNKITERSIDGLRVELATAEAAIDKETINKLTDFNKRIKAIEVVLNRHVAVSEYLKLLGNNTITSMSYSSLKYTAMDSEKAIVAALMGVAPSYGAIAQAEKILKIILSSYQ